MPETFPTVLAIDDDTDLLATFKNILRQQCHVVGVSSGRQALHTLQKRPFDLILLDIHLPDISGLDLIPHIRASMLPPPIVMVSALQDTHFVVQAVKRGAEQYICKPFDVPSLQEMVQNILGRTPVSAHSPTTTPTLLWGKSKAMQDVQHAIQQVAPTDVTVLITGESGTGKELIAESIHAQSNRKQGPFIPINCAAVPEQLIESELFGHEKGAFTSALTEHKGKFERAAGGTLFLDEVATMPAAMQAKLLRVLQTKSIERVGGTQPLETNFRLIAATNLPLLERIQTKTFREDLFYRLSVVTLDLPPLRARMEDLALLIPHFIQKYNARFQKTVTGIRPDVFTALRHHLWPGNIRELENVIARGVALAPGGEITADHLPMDRFPTRRTRSTHTVSAPFATLQETLLAVEREEIIHALTACRWNQTQAARQLGINRTTLIAKMKAHAVNRIEKF